MRTVLLYVGIGLALAAAGAGAHTVVQHRARQVAAQNTAAHDPMLLPSQSQRLMQFADTLTAPQRDTLFRHHELAPLFQLSEGSPSSQNGFFGAQPQRLEVVFRRITADTAKPGAVRVEGLARVAGRITALRGGFELRQVRRFRIGVPNAYISTGTFHFQQCATNGAALADWAGAVAVDFEVAGSSARLFAVEGAIRNRSRLLAFEGHCTDHETHKKQRLLWAEEFAPVGNTVLADFDIGGRMAEINPKYQQYGWNEYYENDEWWADSPAPSLNL